MNKDDFIKMMENGYNSLVREETLEEKSFRLGYTYALNDLFHIIMNNDKEIERLNNIIKIMEKYFELIIDLGYDYDGFNKEDSLKKLIDELCKYASLGRVCNTTETIYVNGDKKYNILHEELKGDEK